MKFSAFVVRNTSGSSLLVKMCQEVMQCSFPVTVVSMKEIDQGYKCFPHIFFLHLSPSHWGHKERWRKRCGERETGRPFLWTLIWSDVCFWWQWLSWMNCRIVELCGRFCWFGSCVYIYNLYIYIIHTVQKILRPNCQHRVVVVFLLLFF